MPFNETEFGVKFITVPSHNVEFESGQTFHVERFQVSQRSVTIKMIDAMKKDTGYVTCAEQDDIGKSYLDNELIEHVPKKQRPNEIAFCLSWYDAALFCEWANLRLPTEGEWMAASILDDNIYDAFTDVPWQNDDSTLDFNRVPPRIVIEGHEITATRDAAGMIIVRYGPQYFRLSDWNTSSRPRYAVDSYEYGLMQTFRVCRNIPLSETIN